MNQIEAVAKFMSISGQTTDTTNLEQTCLYQSLVQEEHKERIDACIAGDIVEEFDADLDILYVTVGRMISAWGLNAVLEGFEEVHNSNMSKFIPCPECQGEGSVGHSTKAKHLYTVHLCSKCNGGKLTALKREDGKTLKGSGYFKPNLKAILEKHGLMEKPNE